MELFPHQIAEVQLIASRNQLIADQCGLGKTAVGIMGGAALPPGPRLVVCPKAVRAQWVEELHEWLPGTPATILEWPDDFEDYNQWYITHYEALVRYGAELSTIPWVYVVLDEAHRIKNRKTKRTHWAKIVARHAYRRVALTGTPMEKHPDDLWSILNFLDEKAFPSYWRFFEAHILTKRNYLGYTEVLGLRNPTQFATLVAPYIQRHTMVEVAPTLPPKWVHKVPVQMDAAQQQLYVAVRDAKDIELITDGGVIIIPHVLAQIVRLQQISSDPSLPPMNSPHSSSKLEWVKEYVADNPEERIVVFTNFRETAQRMAMSLGAALIMGGIQTGYDDWRKGLLKVLVGTIAGMGEGLSLGSASTAIFLDQHWSSTKMSQAVDRIYRIDITEPKNIIHLYSVLDLNVKPTIDSVILQAVENKWTEIELVHQYIKERSTCV